jgi:hypothetical protein
MDALLADLVLALHVGIVAFVVGGLVLIVAGNRFGWAWVNGWQFRLLHLAAIAVVVAESWLGITCPLTTLENALRIRAGAGGMGPSFIGYWLQRVLYYDAPPWVFAVGYTLFGAAVVWAWVRYPPRRRGRAR